MKWLIYGASGWIGSQVVDILLKQNEIVIKGISRLDHENDVFDELEKEQPDRVISLIGRTHGEGYATIDYLEQKGKLVENVRDNLYSPLVLAIHCQKLNIHFTYLGTGCIFNGYLGYNEESKPDFFGSSYSVVKGFTDQLMHMFSNTLNVRIRMPITDEPNSRNFITKILNYKKICDMPNSMTVLPELLPMMIKMAKQKQTGTINLTNPGMISHNEILEMARVYVPNLQWENMTLEEQSKMLKCERSNNLLLTDHLQSLFPEIMNIKQSVQNVIHSYFNKQ